MAKLLKGNLENVDLNSPLFRYLCAQSQSQSSMDALKQHRCHLSQLSPLENLMERSPPSIVYRKHVRGVQREEVLVMDGVSVTRGGRSSMSASDLLSSSSSSDSPGKILYQTDLCSLPNIPKPSNDFLKHPMTCWTWELQVLFQRLRPSSRAPQP
ncbi:unnamed protein product [Prunus armeniaca]|uniref:Uncharacterized protein n=1 Tax=Prunus armeniaca TaxID=36596 RepID=A0A6J5WKH5_PRUAR|nr:unnamed protein product [Prunus armeniaca]